MEIRQTCELIYILGNHEEMMLDAKQISCEPRNNCTANVNRDR